MPSSLLAKEDFHYQLPPASIAYHPSQNRDQSRLLYYRKGKISDHIFKDINVLLEPNSLLVRNNSAVIPCKLFFPYINNNKLKKIECFILSSPNDPQWQNIQKPHIGNITLNCYIHPFYPSMFSQNLSLDIQIGPTTIQLKASILKREPNYTMIEFVWNSNHSFWELLSISATPPLPPYIKREVNQEDRERYQNIYAEHWGSVAAPTAGLHFSNELLTKLAEQGIKTLELCLHVNSDTFKPMRCEFLHEHQMHGEFFKISSQSLQTLIQAEKIIAIGTTTMRSLESLYYLGCKVYQGCTDLHTLKQDEILNIPKLSPKQALSELLNYLKKQNLSEFKAHTFLFIYPPNKIQIAHGLITNFHQPYSTLLALCAAFVGSDWRNIYQHALDNNYRFLSYGDSSLLIP